MLCVGIRLVLGGRSKVSDSSEIWFALSCTWSWSWQLSWLPAQPQEPAVALKDRHEKLWGMLSEQRMPRNCASCSLSNWLFVYLIICLFNYLFVCLFLVRTDIHIQIIKAFYVC